MSLKNSLLGSNWPVLCSLTLGLTLTACNTPPSTEPSSSSSSSSSVSVSSSSSSSVVVSSSSSSSSVPRPSGPPVDTRPANASGQSPAFQNQTDAPGATSPFTVRKENISTNLNKPWAIEFLPDGRLIVTEKGSSGPNSPTVDPAVKIVNTNGTVEATVTGLPISDIFTRDQAGLMDVAVSPNFESDRTLYFSFAETQSSGEATTVVKAQLSSDDRRLENLQYIWRQTPKWKNIDVQSTFGAFTINGHFGSRIAFDHNGNLFISMGERYNDEIREQAQTLDNFIGKVVHITPDGGATLDNPMVNQQGVLPEIWSYGHRNVQAIDVHPLTGEVWTVDHGPQGGDEVNKPEGGKNYGWPVITYGRNYDFLGGASNPIGENRTSKDGLEQPRYYWDPVIAPSCALFYDGDMFPEWENNLIIGGIITSDLTRLIFDGDEVIGEERIAKNSGRVRDIAFDEDGAIWMINDEGQLMRVYR